MKKSCISILFIMMFVVTYAQEGSTAWGDGKITLVNGITLKGKISVAHEFSQDLVLVHREGKWETYASHQVNYFEFWDQKQGGLRKFFALPHQDKEGSPGKAFFELLTDGENLTLLARRTIEEIQPVKLRSKLKQDLLSEAPVSVPLKENTEQWYRFLKIVKDDSKLKAFEVKIFESLYFIDALGRLRRYTYDHSRKLLSTNYTKFEKKLFYELTLDKKLEIQEYIKDHKFDIKHKKDLIQVIDYYNRIKAFDNGLSQEKIF
ncbi:hypothetical protein AAG747_00485 [Rapidithrix thailandica]|uniref:Uncharacterized protein n=1 Tax=Rapidithrix thailandica TaxID=413964 RepID=A0AAW9RZK5_9BACT